MRQKGVRLIPIYGRQAFKIDGKFKFWGGLTVESVGGGPGLVNQLTAAAKKRGIEIRYSTRGMDLLVRRQPRRGRARAAGRRRARDTRQIGSARLRRLRGQSGMAHALSGPGLGSRESARHPLQHRRRHPHGARHRRRAARQLVGLPRRAVGDERAGIRRPRGRRPVPEALLSVLDHDQCHRQALRRRGRRFPQLHLCQIRPRRAGAARPVRLADLRPEDQASAARRIQHPPDHQGDREHHRGVRQEARRRQRRRVRQDHQGI